MIRGRLEGWRVPAPDEPGVGPAGALRRRVRWSRHRGPALPTRISSRQEQALILRENRHLLTAALERSSPKAVTRWFLRGAVLGKLDLIGAAIRRSDIARGGAWDSAESIEAEDGRPCRGPCPPHQTDRPGQ